MNMYTSTKKTKKFILILVLLILFNFCYPKQVKAIDFLGNVSSLFFLMERGLITFLNDLFCDKNNEFVFLSSGETGIVKFTPENIIKGKFILFDANIFRELGSYGVEERYDQFDWLIGNTTDSNTSNDEGAKRKLRNTISGWYYSLLTFSLVALLSVLVYVGIRMVVSTISQDKAKYKIMFKDWLVAVCLLIVMHYIMIGVLNITSMITDTIGTQGGGSNYTTDLMNKIYAVNENKNDGWWTDECDGELDGVDVEAVEGCRFHFKNTDGDVEHLTIGDAFAYEFVLGYIVFLTFLFAWKYLKREFTIIFLILLGPISCITYPIDKISDGKAQAFNKWLTEFIYNVLVQPFHLLLYLVLCGSAVELASENVLYGLACLSILMPAEKFVKEMFGFKDKLGSPLGAAATGALASQLMNKVKGGSGKNNNVNETKNSSTPAIRENINNSLISGENSNGSDSVDADAGSGSLDANTGSGSLDAADESNSLDASGESSNLDTDGESNGIDESGEDGENSVNNLPDDDNAKPSIKDKAKGFVGRAWDAHNQRATEKWGSAKRSQRWINRSKTLAKNLGKGSVKLAGGLVGAAVGASLGALSGKGIAVGAMTGASLASGAVNKAGNVVSDYRRRMQTPDQINKQALKNFKGNKEQREKAKQSFLNKNRRYATNNELEQELNDRFELSKLGLTDNQIDDAVGRYQDLKEANNGMTDEQALHQSALEAVEADKNKGKFAKESDMKSELAALTKRLGGNEDKAREILESAAIMKGETAQLPPKKISFAEEMLKSRGVTNPTKQQIKQEQDYYVKLQQDYQIDENDIRRMNELASNSGKGLETVVERVIKTHADWQVGRTPKHLVAYLGKDATSREIHEETIERLEIEFATGITNQDRISDIRELEQELSKGNKEKITEYRQLGEKVIKNGGKISKKDKLSNDKDMVALAEMYAEAYKEGN